jgi:alpha/beta superfamily hydrolase
MDEAKELVKNGKGYQLLTNIWNSHAGVLPQNANSYINFFSENSELSKALPLRKGKNLTYYQNIKVPILGVICETDPWTVIPVVEAVNLMKNENKNAQIVVISNTDHSFTGKQKELVDIVEQFIDKKYSGSL